MAETIDPRVCPLCRVGSLTEGEPYCPRCCGVLDRMFPEGWQTMEPEVIEAHYRKGRILYEDDEENAEPDIRPAFRTFRIQADPSRGTFGERHVRLILLCGIAALVLSLIVRFVRLVGFLFQ